MRKLFTILFLLAGAFASQAQVLNKAASFTGTATSKASFGNISSLNGVNKFTFEAWVYIDQWNQDSYIFRQMDNASNRIGIQLSTSATKKLLFFVGNGVNNYAIADNCPINAGEWHHISMSYDGSQTAYNMIKVFIDGVSKSLTYSSGNGTLSTTTPTTTSAFELAGNSFAGKFDEVRLWNTNLSETQIDFKNTINNRHPLIANLLAYWKMDQNANAVVDYKGSQNGTLTDATLVTVTDNTNFVYRMVSSYIRSSFYENNQISDEALLNNNDIIYMAANVKANGDLFYEYPINDGVLTNASYLASFDGRNGVLDFSGTGAKMMAGKDLMTKADAGTSTFTFSTWVYVDSWVENSYIFRKLKDTPNRIDIQLGPTATNTLFFHVANGANTYAKVDNGGITPGAWHHLAMSYNGALAVGQQLKIYIDGVLKPYGSPNGILGATTPFIDANFELGFNFDGKLDETSVSSLTMSQTEIQAVMNAPIAINSWNSTKTTAYWKYDDSANPGKDSRTWVGVLNGLKNTLNGKTGAKLRLGIIGGDWKTMAASPTARTAFANNVNSVLSTYNFDGVDLDFEWCYSTQEWTDYSNTILELKPQLPTNSIFSVTLHPLYYKISAAAIAAIDFASIQSYGPSPDRYPYNEFVSNVSTILNYGYPKNKVVMGLPFYAAASDNSKVTTTYKTIVSQYPSLSPALDIIDVSINSVPVSMTYNGQETIVNKAKYIRDQDLLGVMYWDLATDVDVSNNLSLLKSLNSILNANLGLVTDATETPLPVSLESFKSSIYKGITELRWVTASEQNNKGFEVQKSLDGKSFEKLGFVNSKVASGNSTQKLFYTFQDNAVPRGTNYYRLKQLDFDGQAKYSEICFVTANLKLAEFTVYPNPAKESINLQFPENKFKTAKLLNATGTLFLEKDLENQTTISLNTSKIAPGTYILVLKNLNGSTQSKKVILN
ncbi:LamG-like jellyroll fold domain-containing protein [Pedobacter arcticus]|uniref:LamG-like jellyroll fold domain-containing protein n=1 Tax=Pedobacter arcticus TaxID=752140 RepID=UPI0002E959C3|nr:LamG-like jellyroll fold domain-containing protein [Pedobacter arcticus]